MSQKEESSQDRPYTLKLFFLLFFKQKASYRSTCFSNQQILTRSEGPGRTDSTEGC